MPEAEQSVSRGLPLAQNNSGSISRSETVNMDMGLARQDVANAESQLDSQKKSDLSLRQDKNRVSNNEIDDLRITSPLPE